jgi:metallo-beta-lactamase family protein
MQIKFLGATSTVTGSKHLLKGTQHNILIDCGLYQGPDAKKNNKAIEDLLKNEKIDAVVLTHAHLDHCGYIPKLVKDGFKGPIFSTEATRDLAKIILTDNASIQAGEIKKLNKNITKEKHKTEAMYEDIHVSQAMALFQVKEYDQTFSFEEFNIKFKKAGHILGASSPVFHLGTKSVQFSGDLGRYDDLTVYPPEPAENVDYLVTEATYGDRTHQHGNFIIELAKIVEQARNNDGVLIIPAFSVGRSQTMMYALYQLFEKHPELELPVFVDSPMTQEVTKLYYKYGSEHQIPQNILNDIESKFKFVHYTSEREKMDLPGRKILLTASGMMSGGHVLHHLQIHAPFKDNIILIVGFQSPDTLGAYLQRGAEVIELEEGPVEVKAQIKTLHLFSSHGDHDQLIEWAKTSYPKKVFITHGEAGAKEQFQKDLAEKLHTEVVIPEIGESYILE